MATRPLSTPRKSSRTLVGRGARDVRVSVGREIRQQRIDAGMSIRRLADLASIDDGFLSLIERGLREPSIAVLTAVASALGGDLRIRIYPGTGPRIRDPIQSAIVEALLRDLHPRWSRHLEVPVYRPVRGVIDAVIHEPRPSAVVSTEVQSELRRIEAASLVAREGRRLAIGDLVASHDRRGDTSDRPAPHRPLDGHKPTDRRVGD